MQNQFPGFYRPTDKDFKDLWGSALFTFDANVLLNLYRYSSATAGNILALAEMLGDRVWLPHQAAQEYQRNRLGVIASQFEAYDEIAESIDTELQRLFQQLNRYRRHPNLYIDSVVRPLGKALDEAKEELVQKKASHPFPLEGDLLKFDPIRERLDKLFQGKIGEPYSETELINLYKTAATRFDKKIPPGYADSKKPTPEAYGDFVLWSQIIDKAKETKSRLILITDDSKEDWWWQEGYKTIGPRPELINEMQSEAGVQFYMYRSGQFMAYGHEEYQLELDDRAIDEVESVAAEQLLEDARLRAKELREYYQSPRTMEYMRVRVGEWLAFQHLRIGYGQYEVKRTPVGSVIVPKGQNGGLGFEVIPVLPDELDSSLVASRITSRPAILASRSQSDPEPINDFVTVIFCQNQPEALRIASMLREEQLDRSHNWIVIGYIGAGEVFTVVVTIGGSMTGRGYPSTH